MPGNPDVPVGCCRETKIRPTRSRRNVGQVKATYLNRGQHECCDGGWTDTTFPTLRSVKRSVRDTCKKWSQDDLERKWLGIEGIWQVGHMRTNRPKRRICSRI